MAINVNVKWDRRELQALATGPFKAAVKRALRKAGSTALRDMRSEAVKRVRALKAIRPRYIRPALTMQRAKGSDVSRMEWSLKVSGERVPLVGYPHRVTRKGVSVEVNRGKRTVVAGSFKATMKSGHVGVFKRKGKARLPIRELFGSRPLDALLHRGQAEGVAERGGRSLAAAFVRLLPIEIDKGR